MDQKAAATAAEGRAECSWPLTFCESSSSGTEGLNGTGQPCAAAANHVTWPMYRSCRPSGMTHGSSREVWSSLGVILRQVL